MTSFNVQVTSVAQIADELMNIPPHPPVLISQEWTQLLNKSMPTFVLCMQQHSTQQMGGTHSGSSGPMGGSESVTDEQRFLQNELGVDKCLILLAHVSDIQLREDISSLITSFLSSASFNDVITTHKSTLLTGLRSEDPTVQILGLKQLSKALASRGDVESLVKMGEVWPELVVSLLGVDDMRVSGHVKSLFVGIAHIDPTFITTPPMHTSLTSSFQKASSVVQTRILDTLTSCGSEVVEKYGELVSSLGRWIQGDDILMQITALDILSKLVALPSGYSLLQSLGGVMETINHIITSPVENPFGSLLRTQIIVFFGRLGLGDVTKLFELNRGGGVKYVMDGLQDPSPEVVECSATSIGQICSTSTGIKLMDSKYPQIWALLAGVFRKANSQAYLAILRAFAAIFAATTPETEFVGRKLYEKMGGEKSIAAFAKAAQNTFPDYKISGYAALRGVAHTKYGFRDILENKVLVSEFVLNRGAESGHEGQVAKYELIGTLLQTADKIVKEGANGSTSGLSGGSGLSPAEQSQVMKLKEYYAQGPYYKKMQSQVAVVTDNM